MVHEMDLFTEPDWHFAGAFKPYDFQLIGLAHRGTDVCIFAFWCSAAGTWYVYIPPEDDFKEDWHNHWINLKIAVRCYPDHEVLKHYAVLALNPDSNDYMWIKPNLKPFEDQEWFQTMQNSWFEIQSLRSV